MKTPAQIKVWLQIPTKKEINNLFKRETLKYIDSLEKVVAAYTERDGRLEERDGHFEH